MSTEQLADKAMETSNPAKLIVQEQLHYVLCVDCKRLFKSTITLSNHLKKIHKEKDAKKRSQSIIDLAEKGVSTRVLETREKYAYAPFCRDKRTACGPLPVINGLEVIRAVKCTDCEHYLTTLRGMQLHLQGPSHEEDPKTALAKAEISWKRGFFDVQSVQLGSKTSLFQVQGRDIEASLNFEDNENSATNIQFEKDSPDNEHGEFPDLDDFAAVCEYPTPPLDLKAQDEGGELETYNEFIAIMKVTDILEQEGLSVKEAASLTCQLGGLSTLERSFSLISKRYLENVAKCAASAAPALLEELFPRDDKWFEPVSARSVTRYSQYLADFLCFAHRLSKRPCEKKLKSLFEEYESEVASNPAEDLQLSSIHNVLKFLCLHRQSKSKGVKGMLVRIYFACRCVISDTWRGNRTYRFVEASEISARLASMQHFILACALFELSIFNHQNSPYQDSSSSSDEKALEEWENRIIGAVSRKANTPLAFVRIALDIAMGILKKNTAKFSFIHCKNHNYCGFVQGIEVSMEFFGRCIRDWQEECEDLMHNKLLLGGKYPPDIQKTLSSLADNLQERANGYSFLSDSSICDVMLRWQKWVLREIANNGRGVDRMFAKLDKSSELWTSKQLEETVCLGKHRLYRTAVQRWLQSCQRLQELLLLCLHFSSGSPARATEICTFRLENSAYGQRSIYVEQGNLVTLCRYSKMRKQHGSDNHILRIPDKNTGYLFKVYLLLFRRIESLFVGRLHGEECKRSHMHWVFANHGVRLSAAKIRTIISSGMAEKGKELGISHVRHFFAEMVRTIARFSIGGRRETLEDFEDTGHAMAGHSTDVSDRHYGRSNNDFIGLGKRSVERSRMFCEEWHDCLFHWEPSRKLKRVRNESPAEDAHAVQNKHPVTDQSIILSDGLKSELKSILNNSLEAFHDKNTSDTLNCQKRSRTASSSNSGCVLLPPRERNREKDAILLLPALRRLLKDPRATFRSSRQADICATVLEATEDVLVIMGTGSGKSLCVLLPVFMECSERCSIIITPLVALESEWKKKCDTYGIRYSSWKDRDESHSQVYIFAVEHIDTCGYRAFVRKLISHGLLKRIVFDEADTPSRWDDFRPSMHKVPCMLGCAEKPVQRVLLSATIPPQERGNVLASVGIRRACLYATGTSRRNLAFFVTEAKGTTVGNGSNVLSSTLSKSLVQEIDILRTNGTKCARIMIFVMRISDIEFIEKEIRGFVEKTCSGRLLKYHGKIPIEERMKIQKLWDSDREKTLRFMICTSALGAGVDARNVKLVYHFGGSSSLVQYAQECGRAGRDGESAKCILLWNENFARDQERLLAKKAFKASKTWEKMYEERKHFWWNEMVAWAKNDARCRRSYLYSHMDGFDEGPCIYDLESNPCDICLSINATGDPQRVKTSTTGITSGSHEEIELVTPVPERESRVCQEVSKSCVRDLSSDFQGQEKEVYEQEGQTTLNNHSKDREVREDTVTTLSKFETLCNRIDTFCTFCLVANGVERISVDNGRCEICKAEKGRCYRCLSKTHRVSDCPLPVFVKNHCNKCGLNKLDGKNAHNDGKFGKKCSRPYLNHLFWLLWERKSTRERILTDLCTSSDRVELEESVKIHGHQGSKTVEKVLSWLHNENGIPVHVHILCWWGSITDRI